MAEVIAAGATVTTAVIAGVFGIVAQRVRRENNAAHEANSRVLDQIDRRTEMMDTKLDRHGEWIAGHQEWHRGRGD